ncbi:MAG: DoxX family protein [Bacteroidales bacterium]|nr:DoxX family protein [Bacteroidales bacterium]
MKKISLPRVFSVVAGIAFLLSGFMKLPDVSGFQNLIIQYGFPYLNYLAPLIILLEILLGMALVLGVFQRGTAIASIIVLFFFTVAYTYGYLVNSVEDCGCFGGLVKSSPAITYIRNIVLIAILIIVVCLEKGCFSIVPKWKVVILLSVMIPSVFTAGLSFRINTHHSKSHPFEGKEVSETSLKKYVAEDGKSKLVLFMSYQCQHCWNSIENYKAYIESGFVDTALCYALCSKTLSEYDSTAILFKESYPEVKCQDLFRDSADFIEATPTAFIIEDNKVSKIIIGGVPSPFLLFPRN